MEFSNIRETPEHNNFGNVFYEFGLKNGTRIGEETLSGNPAELGIVTGLLTTACIFNLKSTVLKEDFFQKPLHLDLLTLKVMFYFVLHVIYFCIFSPFVFLSLVLLYAYRCAITLALKIQLGEKFAGLLEGTDAVWAVEDSSCKSVINVVATLEAAPHANTVDLLLWLRELAQQKLVGTDARLDKLSCLRKKKYGYFYWERRVSVDIPEHVRWLDTIDNENHLENESNEESFNKILSRLCTQPLPQNGQASWEILVSQTHLRDNFDRFKEMEEGFIFCPSRTNMLREIVAIPIIFRVHHTVGDGFTLLRLLLATIADSKPVEVTFQENRIGTSPAEELSDETKMCDLRKIKLSYSDAELLLRKNKDLLGASMPFSLIIGANLKETVEKYLAMKLGKFVSFQEFVEAISEFGMTKIKETTERLIHIMLLKLTHIAKLMSILIKMPSCLIHQALYSMDNRSKLWELMQYFGRKWPMQGDEVLSHFLPRYCIDSQSFDLIDCVISEKLLIAFASALHGPKLSGEKIISFWNEGDFGKNIDDRNLLTIIQEVKNATGTKFSDVILAALSASLHKYFKQIGEFAPKSLTVVLPSRMSISDENLRLDNGFSVGLLPLCISEITEDQSTYMTRIKKNPTMMERLFDVARSSHILRGQSDYLVNFWVMKWLSAVLPEVLLRPILKSNSTMIFSNIPGPQEVHILGQKLRNIVFWVPHRGTTGIGFSVLSYGGNLHFGLLVDKALIKNENLLDGILETTVQEIHKLHGSIFMTHFSKSLHNLSSASTNTESECCK